jgi:hypothetical protein
MYTANAMSDRAYITVVRWPSGFSRDQRAAVLVDALGLDPYSAGQRAVHEPPLVLSRVDAAVAPDIIGRFKAHKVPAFALTQSYLADQPRPLPVKRLVPALGAAEPMYMAELWAGDPVGLRTSEIFLLVRATLDKSSTTTRIEPTGPTYGTVIAAGVAGTVAVGAFGGGSVERTTTHKFIQIIDLFMEDGRRFRINSGRVSFDVLGSDRGLTPRENTDKLALRLATEAPQALLDTGFDKFRIPPDFTRDLVGIFSTHTRHERDDTSVFDFYSIWTYTIHRGLVRSRGDGAG